MKSGFVVWKLAGQIPISIVRRVYKSEPEGEHSWELMVFSTKRYMLRVKCP